MDVFVTLFYLFASLSAGEIFYRLLVPKAHPLKEESYLGHYCTLFLLGQGALSAVWLFLAILNLFFWHAIIAVLCLCLLGGGKRVCRGLKGLLLETGKMHSGFKQESIAWKALVCLVLALLLVMVEYSWIHLPDIDSLAFYLTRAKLISGTHRLTGIPTIGRLRGSPLVGEMHTAALMSLCGREAGSLNIFLTLITIGILLAAIGERGGMGFGGLWILLALLLTSDLRTLVFGKIDLYPAALGIGAFYWALRFGGTDDTPSLRIAGLFTGLAVASKFTYAVILPPAVLLLLWWRLAVVQWDQKKGLNPGWILSTCIASCRLGFWALLPLIPQAIKNLALFGEPLAPLYYFSGESSLLGMTAFPGEKRFIPPNPFTFVFAQFPSAHVNLSPLCLAFGPLVFFLPRPRSWLRSPVVQITVAGLLGVVLWSVTRPYIYAPRYILASLFVFFLPVSRATEFVLTGKRGPAILRFGIFFCLLANLLVWAAFLHGECSLYFKKGEQPRYASHPDWQLIDSINRDAPPNAKIFFIMDNRYWLRMDLIQNLVVYHERNFILSKGSAGKNPWEWIHKRGYQYLVVHPKYKEFSDRFKKYSPPAWLKLTPLLDLPGYEVFRIEQKGKDAVNE